MRSVRPILVVPGAILALLAGACGDAPDATPTPDTTRAQLADEVEHVAALLEDGRECAALEAVRVLEVMADRTDDPVRAAVDQFTAGVRDTVQCDPDEDDTDDSDDSDDDDDRVDEGNRGDGPPPGRGRGRGQGN